MTEGKSVPGPTRTAADWEARYKDADPSEMPWFHPDLDADLVAALDRWGPAEGPALDQGTGPGTQAVELARRGYHVTATDVSPTAIEKAKARAAAAGVEVDFRVDDVLESALTTQFDLVFDRGCFHVFTPDRRPAYLQTMARLVRSGGFLFLKTFSHLQPGDFGPHRVHPDEIRALFAEAFEIESIEHTVFEGNNDPLPKAIFSVLRRR